MVKVWEGRVLLLLVRGRQRPLHLSRTLHTHSRCQEEEEEEDPVRLFFSQPKAKTRVESKSNSFERARKVLLLGLEKEELPLESRLLGGAPSGTIKSSTSLYPHSYEHVNDEYKKARKESHGQSSIKSHTEDTNWQLKVRRKHEKARMRETVEPSIDYEILDDSWKAHRLEWILREIPTLRPAGIVLLLNGERKWLTSKHGVQIVEGLLEKGQILRAHRVHRWMQQQEWYSFDHNEANKLATVLAKHGKLTRVKDLYEEVIDNGIFLDKETYIIIIKAYLDKEEAKLTDYALMLYTQMTEVAHYKAPPDLQTSLLKSLTCPSGKWALKAAHLLESMRSEGVPINSSLYARLIKAYAYLDNHNKVDELVAQLKKDGMGFDLELTNAILLACSREGNVTKAENALSVLVKAGFEVNYETRVHLMHTYGKAGSHKEALQIFELAMKDANPMPADEATKMYEAVLSVASGALEKDKVEKLLERGEGSGCGLSQRCYIAVMEMYMALHLYGEVGSMFERMRARFPKPSHSSYRRLLESRIREGEVEEAEVVFERVKAKGGMGPTSEMYSLMLEGYTTSGRKDKADEVFHEMLKRGYQVDPRVKGLLSPKRRTLLDKARLRLNDEHRDILVGVLMAGAQVTSDDDGRTYSMCFTFDPAKEGTCLLRDHLQERFFEWLKPDAKKGERGGVPPLALETISHGSFRFYAHQYRPDGAPLVPKLIHRWLTPRVLAYWYMYGGRKCQRTGGIVLNAGSYSAKETRRILDALRARKIEGERIKRRRGVLIRFQGESASWLWNLMKPFVIEGLDEILRPIPTNQCHASTTFEGAFDIDREEVQ